MTKVVDSREKQNRREAKNELQGAWVRKIDKKNCLFGFRVVKGQCRHHLMQDKRRT